MNPAITRLKCSGAILSWNAIGKPNRLELPRKITNALALHSDGIAVVLEGNNWDDGALIVNADGSLRAELKNPFPAESGIEFYHFMYECGRLVLILASTRGDFRCTVDEATGLLSEPQETR
jgi:hypothetical protein